MDQAGKWERIWSAQEVAGCPRGPAQGLKPELPAGSGQRSQCRKRALGDWHHQSEDIKLASHVRVEEGAPLFRAENQGCRGRRPRETKAPFHPEAEKSRCL